VVGIRIPMPEFAWHIVMEQGRDQILAEVTRLRTRTLLGVGILVALIGFLAYLLSRGIVAPLASLTEAAGRVADGDLDVQVPVRRGDELGTATQVFNDMVEQLRHSRERLEQLSTTDALTQLANRRHVLHKLATHLERFQRSGTPFSVLLIDADNFKGINDDVGHVVGDKVLSEMGAILNRELRTVDAAGRYGGEEFLVVLDDTRVDEALEAAERIRLAIETTQVTAEDISISFTVSIGVAEISAGEDEDQLIMRADAALYQAKDQGRNRSMMAKSPDSEVA
jgi:diguanylate cyclase (GGDEF)-like protein